MKAKVTLSLDGKIISEAKKVDAVPIAKWVHKVSEGTPEYVGSRKRKQTVSEYFNNRMSCE